MPPSPDPHPPTEIVPDGLGPLLGRPATALAETAVADATLHSDAPRVDPDAPSLDLNATPDRYEARTSLGEGGMGEVRLCKDKRIGREVAMKVVRKGHGSRDDLRSRFLREARVQGQLEHPAIVPVYDLGVDAQGGTYFTMKRVRGMTLEQILDALRAGDEAVAQKYSRRKLLSAFDSVCLAVHFAHTRGVLHRDLKPANVMLGDFGEVYVLDWGLAKIVGVPDREALGPLTERDAAAAASGPVDIATTDLGPIDAQESAAVDMRTAEGAIMGTPGFMSPEQLRGEGDGGSAPAWGQGPQTPKLDARSDVYALGAILFELLTLEPLHARTSVPGIVASTLEGVDARASVRAPARDVPPELEALCVRATALAPADRFASARDLADALERYLDGDRDTARRRELAADHARAAQQAADRALAADVPPADSMAERSRAIADVGRALALDPAAPGAIPTLVRLLSEAPREVPAEVREQLEADTGTARRVSALTAAGSWLSALLMLPCLVAMGVRSWPAVVAMAVAFVVSSGVSFRGAIVGGKREMPVAAMVATTIAMATTAAMFGPLLVTPLFAAIGATAFVLNVTTQRKRVLGAALVGSVILAPLALEWAGVLPPSLLVRDGELVFLPRAFAFTPAGTVAFLAAVSLALVGTAARVVGRVRTQLTRAEERVHVFAWQLRQLMPDEARGLVDPRAGGGANDPLLDGISCHVERHVAAHANRAPA